MDRYHGLLDHPSKQLMKPLDALSVANTNSPSFLNRGLFVLTVRWNVEVLTEGSAGSLCCVRVSVIYFRKSAKKKLALWSK